MFERFSMKSDYPLILVITLDSLNSFAGRTFFPISNPSRETRAASADVPLLCIPRTNAIWRNLDTAVYLIENCEDA